MTEYGKVTATTAPEDVDKIILSNAKRKIIEHPIQFVFLSSFDWIKMFFWESTKIGFVEYPSWMEKIYNQTLFKDSLRLFISLLSLGAFFGLLKLIRNPCKLFNIKNIPSQELWLRFTIGIIVLFYTGFHALFNTVPRWALPIAPLYLVIIGYVLQQLWPQTKNKNPSS
jgi:hypothetical protein